MTATVEKAWRVTDGAVVLRIRLTPKGGRDAIEGLTATPEGPAIKSKVRAAPEDNAANYALVALLADWLGIAKRQLSLVGGHKSRTKSVAITGDTADIESRIVTRLSALST